jgi:hypothetical protein
MSVDINYVLLDLQRALLWAIVPSTRAVTVKINEPNKTLDFCFFYDEEVTDELFDLASAAPAEITIPLGYLLNEKIEYLDTSNPIPIHGELAYLRYEPRFTPIIKKMNWKHLAQDSVTAKAALLLDMQEALLGKVTPSLREVNVYPDMDKKKLQLAFYFDGEISKFDFDLAISIVKEGNWSFPGFDICHEIIRLDYPNKIPWDGKMRAAYARCEEIPRP